MPLRLQSANLRRRNCCSLTGRTALSSPRSTWQKWPQLRIDHLVSCRFEPTLHAIPSIASSSVLLVGVLRDSSSPTMLRWYAKVDPLVSLDATQSALTFPNLTCRGTLVWRKSQRRRLRQQRKAVGTSALLRQSAVSQHQMRHRHFLFHF